MRIGDDRLLDRVPLLRVDVDDAVAEHVRRERFNRRRGVQALFVREAFTVGDDQLKVANLCAIDGRTVDFRDDAVEQREPHPARSRICRADAVLIRVSPFGLDPGSPEGLP